MRGDFVSGSHRLIALIVVLAVVAVAGGPGSALAATIYASTGGSDSELHTIDTVALTTSLIGGFGLNRVGGIDFNSSGVLYAVDGGSAGPSSLYTVDPNTAVPTLIGGIPTNVDSIKFDAAGTLYGAGYDGTGVLLTLNPATAGVLTSVTMSGTGNSFAAGLAFDASGTLFGSRGNASGHLEDLVTIDLSTGIHTAIGPTTNVISDLVFVEGVLYGGSPTGELFTIDPTTGTKTLVFNTGLRIAGLAVPQSPEEPGGVPGPAPLVLLGLGLIATEISRRRRRSLPSRAAS